MSNDPNPAEALAAIGDARAALAERLQQPWGWDLAQAVATGGIFAAFALPAPWGSLAMVPFVLAVTWLSILARNRSGVWLNAAVPASARQIQLAVSLLLAGLLLVVLLSSLLLNLRWPSAAAGVVATVATFMGRRAWFRACRRDLLGEG